MSPHLSQLNVPMAPRNYFRWNNLQILKLATERLKITALGAYWHLFRLERIAKSSYFILSTQNIKFYWFIMKTNKLLLPIWWYNRGLFPLRNKYFGVFVLNGLKPCLELECILLSTSNFVSMDLCCKTLVFKILWNIRCWNCTVHKYSLNEPFLINFFIFYLVFIGGVYTFVWYWVMMSSYLLSESRKFQSWGSKLKLNLKLEEPRPVTCRISLIF